jgi:hypothetical protein
LPAVTENIVTDLDELETQASRDPASVDPETHARLAEQYWERAQNLEDYRDYRDALKRTMFFIEHAVDHGFSDQERLHQFHDWIEGSWDESFVYRQGQLQLQAKIRARSVPVGSDRGPEILERDRGDTVIQGRTLLLGDVGWQPDSESTAETPDNETLLEWMREGHRFGWRTGRPDLRRAMNRYTDLELRYVDGEEPRLPLEELESLFQCTSTLVLRAPTGRLAFGRVSALNPDPSEKDADESSPEDQRVTVDVPSGSTYRTFMCSLSPTEHLAIVAETSDTPPNDVDSVTDSM